MSISFTPANMRLIGTSLALSVFASVSNGATFDPQLFVRNGDPAGVTPGTVHVGPGVPQINNNGFVVFNSTISSPTGGFGQRALFTSDGLVFQEGDPVPGIPGATFKTFSQPNINNNDEFAFGAIIDGPGITSDDNYVLFGPDGVIVRNGDTAPNTSGATFAYISTVGQPAKLNDAGDTIWVGTLEGGDATVLNRFGVFGPDGPILRSEDPLPQIPGWSLRSSGDPVFNNAGDVAFVARNNGNNDYAVLTSNRVVAQTDGTITGLTDVSYASFPSGNTKHLHMNNLGEVSYVANLKGLGIVGDNNKGLFIDDLLIAQKGEAAVGIADLVFDNFFGSTVSDTGALLFGGLLRSVGTTSINSTGLFYRSATGEMELVLRTGDMIDAGNGIMNTVNSFNFIDGISDNGQYLAFSVNYKEGGRGIYTANLGIVSAVPLPAGLPLLGFAIGALALPRRRA